MDKKTIRAEMKARRKAVSPASRAAVSRAICERLFVSHPALGKAISKKGPIAVYLASKEEIDLTDFIASALSFGCALVAPRWNGTLYELVRIESLDRLVAGPHGILEPPAGPVVAPREVRAWLVPGLAFTKNGARLGYGGGWYDRLLEKVPKRIPKIGIAYGFQIVGELPREPHDIRLTDVVSCEDLADVKPLANLFPEPRCSSFWTLRMGPSSKVADAVHAQMVARPYTWGVGLWPSDEDEAIAKRCAEILTEAFECKSANLIPSDTMGGVYTLDYWGDLDDVDALLEIEEEFGCSIPEEKLMPERIFAEFVEAVRSGRGQAVPPRKKWNGLRWFGEGLAVVFVACLVVSPFYLFYDSYRRWSAAPLHAGGAMLEFAIAGLIMYLLVRGLCGYLRDKPRQQREEHWKSMLPGMRVFPEEGCCRSRSFGRETKGSGTG